MSPVLLLFVAAVLPDALPPSPGAEPPGVTEQAFDAVGPGHLAWQSLEGAVVDAEAEVREAGTLPNPTLDFGREGPDGLPKENTWLLT